jgi:hypothetical protein
VRLRCQQIPLRCDQGGSVAGGQPPDAAITLPIGPAAEVVFDDDGSLLVHDHAWARVRLINLQLDPQWLVRRPRAQKHLPRE